MIVLKHALVLLASLATLAAASPTSAQWQKPDASVSVVAHHGKPSDPAAGSSAENHEHGNWQTQGNNEEDEHKGSSVKGNGGGKVNQHQARDEGAPSKHRTFAKHKGDDALEDKSSGKDGKDDIPKHHYARAENVLATLRKLAQQEEDDNKLPRDIDHNDHGDEHDDCHDMEHGSHNQTETREHAKGKLHNARASNQKGVYECANQNWLHPCVYTPLKEGQCYNRLYGRLGSMGPDNGLSCTIYEASDCNDHGWNTCGPFVWPGIKNYQASHLLLYHGMADDGIFSIKCKYT